MEALQLTAIISRFMYFNEKIIYVKHNILRKKSCSLDAKEMIYFWRARELYLSIAPQWFSLHKEKVSLPFSQGKSLVIKNEVMITAIRRSHDSPMVENSAININSNLGQYYFLCRAWLDESRRRVSNNLSVTISCKQREIFLSIPFTPKSSWNIQEPHCYL